MTTDEHIDTIRHIESFPSNTIECSLISARLKSIEGVARGIQRMINEKRDCHAIIDQLMALRAAAHAVTMEAVEDYARICLHESKEDPDEIITQMLTIVSRLTR